MEQQAHEESYHFKWDYIGDLKEGRRNLGPEMPVIVYRLMEYTMRDTLTAQYGEDACVELFRRAGTLAGKQFTEHFLDLSLQFNEFISALQKLMADLKIGILRVERVEPDGTITLTVSEDLDCSGLPVLGETVCNYDEGFIKGILWAYSGQEYKVKEIDCWAKGDRVCRFRAAP